MLMDNILNFDENWSRIKGQWPPQPSRLQNNQIATSCKSFVTVVNIKPKGQSLGVRSGGDS